MSSKVNEELSGLISVELDPKIVIDELRKENAELRAHWWTVFEKADEATWPVVKSGQGRRFIVSKDGYVFIATYIYGAFAIDENQTIDIDAWQAIPSGYKQA